MPTRDEDGNIIGLDGFLIALRGDDAREFILPGSIPEAKIAPESDPVKHDCPPPLEAPPEMEWILSDEISKSLIEFFDREEKLARTLLWEYLQSICGGMGATVEELDPPRRMLRKRIRWDERNRRRKLKGLQEKGNPYNGSCYFAITIPVNQPVESVKVVFG